LEATKEERKRSRDWLDDQLTKWEKDKKAWEDEDPDEWDWSLHRPEESLKIYKLMQNFRGEFGAVVLPFPGSLLEQPQWFLEDFGKISMRRYIREEESKGNAPIQDDA